MLAALFSQHADGRIVEVDALGYQRMPIEKGKATFPPASEDWPPLTHFAVVFSAREQPRYVMPIMGAPFSLRVADTCTIECNATLLGETQDSARPHIWMDDWPEVIGE
jgi:hypothetical protein